MEDFVTGYLDFLDQILKKKTLEKCLRASLESLKKYVMMKISKAFLWEIL